MSNYKDKLYKADYIILWKKNNIKKNYMVKYYKEKNYIARDLYIID